MNREDLEARMKAAMMPQGEVGFDPITLLVLAAALSALVSWIVERCLNKLFPESVQNPGWLARHRLRAWSREAVRRAVDLEAPLAPITEADEAAMANRLYEAALQTGRGMSAADLTALKATCGART